MDPNPLTPKELLRRMGIFYKTQGEKIYLTTKKEYKNLRRRIQELVTFMNRILEINVKIKHSGNLPSDLQT